jgi:hypothetical protein
VQEDLLVSRQAKVVFRQGGEIHADRSHGLAVIEMKAAPAVAVATPGVFQEFRAKAAAWGLTDDQTHGERGFKANSPLASPKANFIPDAAFHPIGGADDFLNPSAAVISREKRAAMQTT